MTKYDKAVFSRSTKCHSEVAFIMCHFALHHTAVHGAGLYHEWLLWCLAVLQRLESLSRHFVQTLSQ